MFNKYFVRFEFIIQSQEFFMFFYVYDSLKVKRPFLKNGPQGEKERFFLP